MKIRKHYKEIYEVENFLDDSIIEKLLSYVDLDGEDGWITHNIGSTMHSGFATTVYSANKTNMELANSINEKMLSFFNNIDRYIPMLDVRRLKSNEFMPPHDDLGPNNEDKNLLFGVVLYLNDNFEGGELNYVDLGIKIKPVKGSLIIHKSTYKHEVLEVTSGKRYCITSFIWGNDNTKINIDI